MAISMLNANQIINIASDFASKYHLNKKEEEEIKKILIEKGNKPFYIFRYISDVKNFLILSKKLKFTIEVPMEEERHFLEELQKKCYMKVTKRRKEENILYNNEVCVTIDVHY